MDQRLSLVTLGVDDLARARAFYEDGLGWRPADAPEGVVFYQLPGMAFALWSRSELAADARTPVDGSFSGISLACNQRTEDDVDRVLAQAQAAGARILKPAVRAEWAATPATSPTRTATCGRSRTTRAGRSPTTGP